MKKKQTLNILMLEDDPLDADLNKIQLLVLDEYQCEVVLVTNKTDYLKAIETTNPDLILSDYNLPQYNGLEALNDLKDRKPLIPFIFVTGTIDEETAAGTIKAGAWDYVVKDRLFRLPFAIRSVLHLKDERINTFLAEEQNRKLSMAVEQCPSHIIITNTKGEIEYVNKRFTEVTGYLSEDVSGSVLPDFGQIFELEGKLTTVLEILLNGMDWRGEIQNFKKNNTPYWENTSISPLKNEKGQITHFIVVKEDITSRKILEKDLIEARDKALSSDKLKEAFLQNLSHEIRTPLNAIVGFAGLLNSNDVRPNQIKEFTKIIHSSSNQLLSIVNDILTISRIETGQEIIISKPMFINEILDNLFIIFHARVHEKDIQLKLFKKIPDSDFSVISDETKVTQVISNLLNNALKFTHKGHIHFGYTLNHNEINFFVEDTGIGIAPEVLPLVFERFRQADSSIQTNYGGTGLGLSISRSFAEMLGGKLSVTSTLGIGSVFTFSVPFKLEKETLPISEIVSQHFENRSMNILVAEDEEFNFMLLKTLLSVKNYSVLHARNGLEAVNICHNNSNIDLVLMDIKMPIMGGMEALTEIRKFRQSLPIIAQTAYALELDRQRLLSHGFNDYISKPIQKDELWKMILNLLDKKSTSWK